MTSKIETTKREMFIALAKLKAGGRWLLKKQNAEAFETALENHLEEQRLLIIRQRLAIADLYMTRRSLVSQVELLTAELDVLKSANKVAGEELRFAGFKVVEDPKLAEGSIRMLDASGKQISHWDVSKTNQCEVFINGLCERCGKGLVEEA